MSKPKKKITEMPNEILRIILSKLKTTPQIKIRGVCRHWKLMIENISQEKRSLVIQSKHSRTKISDLSEQFNGSLDIGKNCAVLQMRVQFKQFPYENFPNLVCALSKDFAALLVKLFPRIENLIFSISLDRTSETTRNLFTLMKNWSSSIVTLCLPYTTKYTRVKRTSLADLITTKLTNLKRLDLSRFDLPKTERQLALNGLEHCCTSDEDILEIVPHLGPNCTSLNLRGLYAVRLENITRWPCHFVKSLTHFSLRLAKPEVFSFICANFVSIEFLRLYINPPYKGLKMILDLNMVAQLSRLSQLSQLSIECVKIDLQSMANLSNLKAITLKSVQTLSLSLTHENGNPIRGDQFCKVLSFILPNVEQLVVKHWDGHVRGEIVQNLGYFSNLRKHQIVWPGDV